VLASDSQDAGTTICAGISNTSQSIPAGYRASYFVAVLMPDGNSLSAGYIREGSTSTDFGQIQSGSSRSGAKSSSATGPGVHNYCVGRTSGGWAMTAGSSRIGGRGRTARSPAR